MSNIKYINERYVADLLGKKFPLGIKRVATLLDQYLNHLADNGDHLPKELLLHNISICRNKAVSEFAKVDADMVLQQDETSQKLNIDLRDYRVETQFSRPLEQRRVVLHIIIKDSKETTWAIHLPLQTLMVGFGNAKDGHQCYAHGITLLNDYGKPVGEEVFYCGITKRGWLKRMTEHFREIRKGSNKIFHKRWRKYQGQRNVLLNSELIAVNHSSEGAMNWEEMVVDQLKQQNRSLNMISGGSKGYAELVKWKVIKQQRP